jgi:hypothetical protein
MELIWIEPKDVNREQWDALCDSNPVTPFVRSAYLDAVSEQWGILWSSEFHEGIPVPFTLRMGVKCAVTPTFLRYVEWVGAHFDAQAVQKALQKHFQFGTLNIRQQFLEGKAKYYQELAQMDLNQQAKRSLKKAAAFKLNDSWEPEKLFCLIEQELGLKVPGIDTYSLPKLKQLVGQHEALKIYQLNLTDNGKWCGGIWYLKANDRMIYLKGTCEAEARNQGGMYRLISALFEKAVHEQKVLDLGGSNVENVRRFNRAFGAVDVNYSQLTWNKAPLWWNLLRALKQKVRN